MSNKRINKAYVRYDGSGRVIPGALILNRFKPKVGNWSETPAYECCNDITTTTTTSTTTLPPALVLRFASAFPVVDPNDVSLWNTKLGSTFTSVSISGFEARLMGGSPFSMLNYALLSAELLIVDDQINSVQTLGQYSLAASPSLNTIKLPALTAIVSNYTFLGCATDPGDVIIYIPLCEAVGPSVLDNSLFDSNLIGKNITLTVPVSRMTCNAGLPDGDIQYLQANNTVTVITV